MINDVVLEGIIVRAWQFADDLLFRLVCYRNQDLPQKPLHLSSGAQRAYETQDAADFHRLPHHQKQPGRAGGGWDGLHVRVHSLLQSRDYQESLTEGH